MTEPARESASPAKKKARAPRKAKAPARPRKVTTTLRVNGEDHEVAFLPHKTLLEVLREDLGLTGTKHGCELGECGTCTVVVDGEPMLSCLLLAVECDGREITTVEGLSTAQGPHPLQRAFADLNAAQCGYCTPGFLCASKALLDRDPSPSRDTIREELAGNLCRCTGYGKIYEAVERAAAVMRGEPVPPVPGIDPASPTGEVARGC
ncbi:MAG: (2Fe-2S)-binding protein [Planctomycetes bacterium]|nr:(2Fe-2S)-binding protein [Planctomycetota bacterium]